jgi:PIN domain nuclease of toxin-antitoxin system
VEAGEPRISPIVELELAYLYEVGRVSEPASAPLASLRRAIDLRVSDASLEDLTKAAVGLSWTRDPFDRLLAAHALVAGVPFVTADRRILENLSLATWD